MNNDYLQFTLSKFVDDFLIDNINNMSSEFGCITDHNDSIHVNKLSIEQYFPWKIDIDFNKLKIDETGKYSITLPKKADHITLIILSYCNNMNKPIVITDATAGVGGNVLSFCKYNMSVNAVEKELERYNYLVNNINEYGYIVTTIHDDYLKIYDKLQQDIIFMDPPWGGINYKNMDDVILKLGDVDIEDLCNEISEKKLAKITVLKLPYNYNLNHIKSKINVPFTIFKIKHILLIIIFNDH